jgi:hypothetical protein
VAFRDGAGTGTFPALRFTATAATAQYAVLAISPADGNKIPATAVALVVDVSNTAGGNSDVYLEVASDSGFSTIVWSTTQTNVANGLLSVIASGLADGTKYWWRARMAPTGTTTWGPYSATRTFTPDLNSGRGFAYVETNVGVLLTMETDVTSVEYVNENVGVELIVETDVTSVEYVNENVGVAIILVSEGMEYGHYGDVNTLPPTPHVWFLKPGAGRSGDGINIYCFGVGDLAETYAGSVELDYGGTIGWVSVPVVSWQTFPPGAEAYTMARTLNQETAYIDMQHSVVEITIPDGALPPGYPLRIRTVTP